MISRRMFLSLLGMTPLARWIRSSDDAYVIPPVVQPLSETSVQVTFRAIRPTTIRLNPTGVLYFIQPDTPSILLEDLEPATTYTLELTDDEVYGVAWGDVSFRTPPFDDPMRVIAVGDTGFGDAVTAGLIATMPDAHLLMHLGDVVYDMFEHENDHFYNWWLKYFQPFQQILTHTPHLAAFGNHDRDVDARIDNVPSFDYVFPQRSGSFMWNGIRILNVNTQVYFSYLDEVDVHNAWLDEQLAAAGDWRYTILMCHVPPFTSSAIHAEDSFVIADRLARRIESSGAVKLVISGHAHLYERLQRNGVHYVIAGGGSTSIYGIENRSPYSVTAQSVGSYAVLDCHEDYIALTAYNLNGDVIDFAEL